MGTQQILLLVLTMIVVGAAVAVGLSMFDHQSYNMNRQAVSSQLSQYAAEVLTYWRTPVSLGGAGKDPANVTIQTLGTYLGFTQQTAKVAMPSYWGTTTDNGEFRIGSISDDQIVIKGLGRETRSDLHPYSEITINLTAATVSITNSDQSSF